MELKRKKGTTMRHLSCDATTTNATAADTGQSTMRQRQARFQSLAAGIHPRLYRYARRALGHRQDAEDIAQETLARAWAHFETFDPRRSFETWVFRIASNLITDLHRRRKRRQEFSLDATVAGRESDGQCYAELADSTGNPHEKLMADEISSELQTALYDLPPLHRTTLLLLAQERSYEQIAGYYGCPVGTVRSRVHRARQRLQRNLNAIALLEASERACAL
jgi:RNA polymerase sigma-70 factor (ECF subfamily)